MKTLEDALAAIEEMKSAHENEKAAILKKNKELIDREKAAKQTAEDAEAAREEAANEAATKAGDIETVKAGLEKKHATELKKLTDANEALTKSLSTLKIDGAISEAIAKNGVLPQHVRAVTLMLKDGAAMVNGEAMVDGVPLNDHVTTWFASADAAHYQAAAANSGAGAQGSTTTSPGHGFTKDNFKSREAEWMLLDKTNPDQARAIALEVGRTDLLSS